MKLYYIARFYVDKFISIERQQRTRTHTGRSCWQRVRDINRATNVMKSDPPNTTIYAHNLNEKVTQSGKKMFFKLNSLSFWSTELRSALHAIFSQFGKVLEIVCAKTYKLRGQAWIIFEEPSAANSALVALEGFVFYDKPLVSVFGSFNIKYFFPWLACKALGYRAQFVR